MWTMRLPLWLQRMRAAVMVLGYTPGTSSSSDTSPGSKRGVLMVPTLPELRSPFSGPPRQVGRFPLSYPEVTQALMNC